VESSKLVSIVKTFDKSIWKAFDRFVRSIYHNRRPKLIELLTLLKKASPQWKSQKLKKQVIYAKLFPGETYIENRMVDLMKAMVKLIEQFWLTNKLTESAEQYRTLALAYHQKGFANYRDICLNKAFNTLRQQQMDTETYHNHLFQHQLQLHHLVEAEGKRNQEPNLQTLHDQFDAYYICTKLKYYCKVLNYQNFRSYQYQISMMDAVLQEATRTQYAETPSVQIYFHGVFTLLSLDNEKNFYALKKLLAQHTQTFSIEELQNIFVLARNFCIKNLRRGKLQYVNEGLDLYKIEIKEGLIFENNQIPDADCRNIIKLALLVNEVDWALQFLNDFKSKISEDIYALNLANVFFEQQQYKAVLKVLSSIHFKEALLELAARALILKTYFQLCRTTNDFTFEDKLDAYIDSFNAFLKRKKEDLTRAYMPYLNFVKSTQAINKLYWKPKINKTKLADIHQQIVNTPETAEWEWLKDISKA